MNIHPTSIVDAGAIIGKGTCIWHWTHVSRGAQIGNDCNLGQNVFVSETAVTVAAAAVAAAAGPASR